MCVYVCVCTDAHTGGFRACVYMPVWRSEVNLKSHLLVFWDKVSLWDLGLIVKVMQVPELCLSLPSVLGLQTCPAFSHGQWVLWSKLNWVTQSHSSRIVYLIRKQNKVCSLDSNSQGQQSRLHLGLPVSHPDVQSAFSPLHGPPLSQALEDLHFLCPSCFLSLQALLLLQPRGLLGEQLRGSERLRQICLFTCIFLDDSPKSRNNFARLCTLCSYSMRCAGHVDDEQRAVWANILIYRLCKQNLLRENLKNQTKEPNSTVLGAKLRRK